LGHDSRHRCRIGPEYFKKYFIQPTIFKDVKPDMRIASAQFSQSYMPKTFDEAFELANAIKTVYPPQYSHAICKGPSNSSTVSRQEW
jgi:acyl-CoA reductase-like NAD-dependent aldehyde dehydrogenase